MIKLLFNLLNNKITKENDYLGLLLKENEGIVFFLRLDNLRSSVIAKEGFSFTNGWNNLAEDIDEVLYRLELKGFKSPDRSIFFVYSNLVDKYKKEIKREFLVKIKEVVKNLELKPLGYIEIHDAVIDLIVAKEGVAISAILVEINNSSLSAFLYKNGKLLHTEQAEKKENITESLSPIFEKMRVENMLPSRILIYDSKNVDREISAILSHTWQKDIFIHHPKVETINDSELVNSLINVFSKQLSDKNLPVEKEVQKDDVMGFVIGEDVNKNKIPVSLDQQAAVEKFDKSALDKPKQIFSSYFSSVKQFIKINFARIKNVKHSRNIFAIAGILLILISFYLIEYFFHKTEITLTLPSQAIEKTLTIENIQPDISTKSASFTASAKATGEKDIGEKAKGEVTIYNFKNTLAEFDKNTKIQFEDLTYLLDADATVASYSATTDGNARIAGQTKVKVTANEIGEEYNISENRKFNIGGQSEIDYYAINDNPISGGSKKEVKTVSEDDIASLETAILKKANQYSKDKIDSNFKQTHTLVNDLGGIDLVDLNYDKEQGEEADTVTLKAKADITYVGLDNDKVKNNILEDLKNDIEKNYVIEKSNMSYLVKDAQQDEDIYIFDIDVSARASEKVDLSNIRSAVVRKNISEIDDIAKKNYKAKKVEVSITNPIPFLKSWTSLFRTNIDLRVNYD